MNLKNLSDRIIQRKLWLIWKTGLFIFMLIFVKNFTMAQEPDSDLDVGVVEKFGEFIPMDTTFANEDGEQITLKDVSGGKPFILNLVYFRCPGICSPLLSEVSVVMDKMDLIPGKDYKVITISFDPDEGYELARDKKVNYIEAMDKKIDPSAWRFLTGTRENITKISEAVGFKYQKLEDGTYAHSGMIVSISPDGRISRYLMGIKFLPFDVKMALIEASEGRVGPSINRFLQYCFSYDPQGRKYYFNLLKITGTFTVLVVLGFFIFLVYPSIRHRRSKEVKPNV